MDSSIVVVINILCNCFLKGFKGRIILLKVIEPFIFQDNSCLLKKVDSIEIIMYNHVVNKYNTSIHNGGSRGAMNSFKGYYGSGTPYAAIRASTYLAMIADEGLAGLTATAHSTPLE